ncbi:hypothetical protein SELR_13570 [Selenomonas ruminantium subsp. lactilytica TAM6421]|uniref:Uncharacterized protein n=1 Tax=Selenomonas ruminantium subsp. lactilytica (strain NBRC 103574 / TAM6421) TaxID=927704 RepID=I0GQM8_SELRL|nr:hypothetical protein [Selenomonas ruminantium]BAL83065.1 hypothetical protein SELR_13570 [Selenomonas ruminantium subsp. lactilytica TAM6421]
MFWNFLIGGVVGWTLANIMKSETDASDKEELTPEEALDVLVRDIRNNAQWAMDECTTDAEREAVYAEVKASVRKLQVVLQEKGEEIIADLRAQAAGAPSKEEVAESVENRVEEFKTKMDGLNDTLNKTLSDLKPAVM